MAVYEIGREPSPDTKFTGAFMLNFPASKTLRRKFLLFVSYPPCGTLLQQPSWPRHMGKTPNHGELPGEDQLEPYRVSLGTPTHSTSYFCALSEEMWLSSSCHKDTDHLLAGDMSKGSAL